jgi:Mg-chelatase subunit ChlD
LKAESSKVCLKDSKKIEMTMTVNFSSMMHKVQDNGLGLDIVFLIDSSGSMEGKKLANVVNSIESLLKILGEKDRVAIISFEKKPKVEIDFIKVYKYSTC